MKGKMSSSFIEEMDEKSVQNLEKQLEKVFTSMRTLC